MILYILITISVAVLFYYLVVKTNYYWKGKGVKQGNPVWIAGDFLGIMMKKESFAELMQKIYNQWPKARYTGLYMFFKPTLIVKDRDLLKQLTVKDFDHFTDHGSDVPADIDPLWGSNLFTLKGQKWRDMRTVLSPSFTSSKMKTMFTLISECAENFTQHFLKKNEDIVTVELTDTFTRFTNDVIATTAFGIKVDSLGEPDNDFYLMGRKATDFSGIGKTLKLFGYTLFPNIYKLLKVKLFPKDVEEFFCTIMANNIKAREEKGIVRQDMINLLLEARKGVEKQDEDGTIDTGFSTAQESDLVKPAKSPKEISDMDITSQAMVFFFAGFETVSRLLCFLSYELATNPDIQDRLREEVRSTLEECKGNLTYEGLLKMKYMDMVVSEALRKWPIAAILDRICINPYTIEPSTPDEKPLHLEKGSLIWVPVFGIHRDPEYYPDPERFDPERFSDENKGKIKPYTFFPFGLGPRNCIGSRFALLEAKIVMFHILRQFELVPVEKSNIPLTIVRGQFNLGSEGGFWFGLKRISS